MNRISTRCACSGKSRYAAGIAVQVEKVTLVTAGIPIYIKDLSNNNN